MRGREDRVTHAMEDSPQRASEWLVALREAPGDARLRRRFEAWRAADPAHEEDWAEISRTDAVLARVTPAHHAHWAFYAAGRDRGPPTAVGRSRRPWRRRVAIAAAAAVVACVAVAVWPEVALRLQADHVAPVGAARTVALDDGSTVRLGPGSAIAVALGDAERRIALLRGEAFFEVVADAGRPFRVDIGRVDAVVTGTVFEAGRDAGGARVGVRAGTVRVEGPLPSVSEALGPGDWVRVRWDGRVRRHHGPPGEVAAWLDGWLVANDRPVAEVVDQLRRSYDGVIVLSGDSLARQPLTGVYDLSRPVAALRAMASAQGATVYELSPWVTVIAGP